jgi:hypothetical protein
VNYTGLKDKTACARGGVVWFNKPCGHKTVRQALTTCPVACSLSTAYCHFNTRGSFQLLSSSSAQDIFQRGGLILHTVFIHCLFTYSITSSSAYLFLYFHMLFHLLCRCPSFCSPSLLSPSQLSLLFYAFLSLQARARGAAVG